MVNSKHSHVIDFRQSPHPLTQFIALDTETTGLKSRFGARPFIFSMCDNQGSTWVYEFPVELHTRKPIYDPALIREIHEVTTRYRYIVFHNSLFDIRMSRAAGVSLQPRAIKCKPEDEFGWDNTVWNRFHDTLALSHVLDSQESHELKDLATKYLDDYNDDQQELKRITNEARRFAKSHYNYQLHNSPGADYWLPKTLFDLAERGGRAVPDDSWGTAASTYALRDAIRTTKLFIALYSAAESQGLLTYYRRERRIRQVTFNMENRGVTLNPARHAELRSILSQRKAKAETEVNRLATLYGHPKLNPRSPKQLSALLFDTFQLKPLYFSDKTGEPSTNADTLKELHDGLETLPRRSRTQSNAHTFLTELLSLRRFNTALTYSDGYDERTINLKRVSITCPGLHANFNPNGTGATRFSSSDPNLQNVGKRDEELKLRQAFGPPHGYFWVAYDYDQLEIRVFSIAAREQTMITALKNGADIHQITADALQIPRSGSVRSGKHINFAWLYGAGAPKLSAMAGLDAQYFNQQMRLTYPNALDFMDETSDHVRRTGYVHTLYGYRLSVAKHTSYIGVNAIVQGTAGDIMKNAMIMIHDYLNRTGYREVIRPIINVHDELVFECHHSAPHHAIHQLKLLMEHAGTLIGITTPVDGKLHTDNWADGEPIEKLFTKRSKPEHALDETITTEYGELFKRQTGESAPPILFQKNGPRRTSRQRRLY